MRVAIIDACIPLTKQESQGMAALWLRYELLKYKIDISSIELADTIFITCVAPEQYKLVARIKREHKTKRVYVGGSASTTPTIFIEHCNGVCVGDGQKFISTMATCGIEKAEAISNVLTKDKQAVVVDQSFPYDAPSIQCEDGAYRLWCGRGCKNKCMFCQTGWAYEYSENPNPTKLIHDAKSLLKTGKRINYLSNDTTQHSFHDLLPKVEHGSFSFKYMQRYGLPAARQVRLGVEGVSERLRKLMLKPISHSDLVKCTAWLNANGRSVRWFMIAGLPTETSQDWEELKQAIQEWKSITQKGVLAVSFTAWRPSPATPTGIFPISDEYHEHFLKFKEWFFTGKGWSNRVKIMFPQDPKNRILSALAEMNTTKEALYHGGDWGPNNIVEYPYKTQRNTLSNRLINAPQNTL